MDLKAILGGKTPDAQQKQTFEYAAAAVSPAVNGDVKLTIAENGFTVSSLFDVIEIPFADVNSIAFADYAVIVKTDDGDYRFSRMGEWGERFHTALLDAYNKAVLRSLFVEGEPKFSAKAAYSYVENGASASGNAVVNVYENCVVLLTPDLNTRRVPLCFVTAMDKGEYDLTLRLDSGESYNISRLGFDKPLIEAAIEKQIRAIREKSLAFAKEIDQSLTSVQASQISKLIPEGAAAQFGLLSATAPSFTAALEKGIAETRAKEYYNAFKTLTEPSRIYIGTIKNDTQEDGAEGGVTSALGGGIGGMLGGLTGGGSPLSALSGVLGGDSADSDDGEEAEIQPPDPYVFWLIVPSPDGQLATVEFSEADSATFVYRTGGDFTAFAKQLNRALEAIAFKREVIRLSDEELRKPDNADYLMAAKRTAALQFVRANFTTRIIHSNPEAWKKKLQEIWNDTNDTNYTSDYGNTEDTAQATQARYTPKFCGNCGAQLTDGVKFCGVCGEKIS